MGVQVVNPFEQHIDQDPKGFAKSLQDLIVFNDNTFDTGIIEELRKKYNVEKKEHFRYLTQVISKKLPLFLHNSQLAPL